MLAATIALLLLWIAPLPALAQEKCGVSSVRVGENTGFKIGPGWLGCPNADQQYFINVPLQIDRDRRIRVQVETTDASDLLLAEADGSVIEEASTPTLADDDRFLDVVAHLDAGRYLIQIIRKDPRAMGNYSVRVYDADGSNYWADGSCWTGRAREIQLNTGITTKSWDCELDDSEKAFIKKFTINQQSDVRLAVNGPAQPLVRFYHDGTIDWEDAELTVRRQPNSNKAALSMILEPGTYYVAFGAEQRGPAESMTYGVWAYPTWVSGPLPKQQPASCSAPQQRTVIQTGGTYTGRLHSHSCSLNDKTGQVADLYTLRLGAPKNIRMEMKTQVFVPELRIVDEQRRPVVTSSGGNSWSTDFVANLPAGVYTVKAGQAYAYQGGSYRLTLSAADGPVAPTPAPPPSSGQVFDIRVCVVENGSLKEIIAQYNKATGDTLVAGQKFSDRHPLHAGYAASAPWFQRRDVIKIGMRTFRPYGLPHVMGIQEVIHVGSYNGVPYFVEKSVSSAAADVIFLAARRGCEFQPYQVVNP